MNNKEVNKILKEFCRCILDVMSCDEATYKFDDKTQKFCNLYKDKFDDLDKVIHDDLQIHYSVRMCVDSAYNEFIRKKIMQYENPFRGFSISVVNSYALDLKRYSLKQCGKKCPQTFELMIAMMAIKFQESNNLSIYIRNGSVNTERRLHDNLKNIQEFYVEKVDVAFESVEKKWDEVRTEIESVDNDVKNMEKKSIETNVTILGIFASVILTFSGMFTFSASVLDNISSVSIYRLVFVSLIIGLISFNLLSFLLAFLNRLRNIENNEFGFPWVLVWCINFIILISMVLTVGCWYKGVVENRNNIVFTETPTEQQTEMSTVQIFEMEEISIE